MKPKARTLAKNFKDMSAAELKALEALLAESIAARDEVVRSLSETPTAPTPATAANGSKPKNHKRNSGAWDEVKIINGRPYLYRREWKKGRLTSKYIGKA